MFTSDIDPYIIKCANLDVVNNEFIDYMTPEIESQIRKYIMGTYPLPSSIYTNEVLSSITKLKIDTTKLVDNIIMYGNYEIMSMLRKHNFLSKKKKKTKDISRIEFLNVNKHALFDKCKSTWLVEAAKFGYLNCLEHAYKIGCSFTSNGIHASEIATKYGNIDCLKYIMKHETKKIKSLMLIAVEYGQLDTLKFLHENYKYLSKKLVCHAISKRQKLCLEYLIKNNCKLTEYHVELALSIHEKNCLKVLLDNACPVEKKSIRMVLSEYRSVHHVRSSRKDLVNRYRRMLGGDKNSVSAYYKYLNYVKFLKEIGFPFTESLFEYAALHNAHEIISYLCSVDCPIDINAAKWAVYNNNLDLLMYFDSKIGFSSFSIDTQSFYWNDSVECLRFLLVNGYKWNVETAKEFRRYSDSRCLVYLGLYGYST